MKKLLLFATFLTFFSTFSHSAEAKNAELYQDEKHEAQLYFKDGRLSFSSNDGNFKVSLNNCIDGAVAFYMPTSSLDGLEYSNTSLSGNDGEFRLSNGFILRRIRLGVRTQIYNKIFADIDIDFDHGSVDIKDAAIKYQFHKNYSIRAGNIKEALSVDQQASWFYMNTLERSMAIQAFTGGRRLGVATAGYGDRWWASVGLFGPRLSSNQKQENAGDDGVSGSGRIVVLPLKKDNIMLHVGVGASYHKPDAWGNDDRVLSFISDTESRVDGHTFVEWSVAGAGKGGYVNNYEMISGEVALRTNKLLLMGEYIGTSISRYDLSTDGNHVELGRSYISGWYAMASYMILGEQRGYVGSEAEFGAMKMRKKSGNLEIMARVSGINFNDDKIAGYEIMGGSALGYCVGLNWYPISNILLGLNYTYMNNDKYADSSNGITYNGDLLSNSTEWSNGIDFSTIQMRAAILF
ncbi:MAG: porin [Rikenellaceae bacterium]